MIVNGIRLSRAFLEKGEDLKLSNKLFVHHPSIEDIVSLGNGILCDEVYWGYVFNLLNDPYDNMVWLDDKGIDYEKVSPFDVFVMRWNNAVEDYKKNKQRYDIFKINPLENIKAALSFFLGKHDFDIGSYENGECILYDKNDVSVQINREAFNYISAFIQAINGINRADKIIPADESAKQILIEDMRSEYKKKLKKKNDEDNDYIGNMIAEVVHGGNGGVTSLNVGQFKIFQIYSGLTIERRKFHSNHILNGVYQGTVSFKDINKQELNWVG